jgi:hypothetical protein
MSRIIRLMTMGGVAALLVSCLVVGSANSARAQDSGWQPWTPAPTVAQPAKGTPPLNVDGCWSGTIEDDTTGTGSGFILFVQKGKKLAHGTTVGLSFNGGPSVTHGITGTVNSQNFKLVHPGRCNAMIRGTISGNDLVGTYRLTKHCLGSKFGGTFDYTFDAGGTTCQ